ncbi:hypothetical protein L208DRAFT_1238949, partial [Tricholoma matsutake]
IEQVTKPTSWRVIKAAGEGTGKEDIIFMIQGIIQLKDLPPFTSKPRDQDSSPLIQYLHQSAGLGSPTFTSTLQAVKSIHDHFDHQFEEGILEPWTKNDTAEGMEESIDLSNRYLMPAAEVRGLRDIQFSPGVNSKGILHGMAQGDRTCSYIHTEDNKVQYTSQCTERARGPSSAYKQYKGCEPEMSWVGDIVQAQVSFIVIPVRGGKCKMLSVLRSLALLEGCSTKVGSIIHYKHHQIPYNLQINQGYTQEPYEAMPKARLASIK